MFMLSFSLDLGGHLTAVLIHLLVPDHLRPVRSRTAVQEEDQRTEGSSNRPPLVVIVS